MPDIVASVVILQTKIILLIGIGAQSTLGGHDIFAWKICMKINKMPEFYMIRAWKITKIP